MNICRNAQKEPGGLMLHLIGGGSPAVPCQLSQTSLLLSRLAVNHPPTPPPEAGRRRIDTGAIVSRMLKI